MSEMFGWAGSLLLSVCSIPQAVLSWKQGHSDGISPYMIWLWGAGMFATLLYVISKHDLPLIINYSFNLVAVWSVIAWYKHFPRR